MYVFLMNEAAQINISKTIEDLRNLPAKRRLNAIIDHPRPLELVRELSAHDVVLTIREIGAEDALELVELLSPSQVQEILDLEIWRGDEIDPSKAGAYFSLLFAADTDRAVNQIHGLDVELVGLMFKMVAYIYDTSIGEEPEDYSELHSTSPGGRFVICFDDSHEKRALSQSLHAFIESLYGRDMKVALGLLEDIRFEMASGLEETSLRLRQHRLLDMGILPREERLVYFSPLRPSDVQLSSLETPIATFETSQCRLPTRKYFDGVESHYPFLWRAINDASVKEQEQFLDYLAHASINMHASLIDDFGDVALIKTSVAYAKALAELGLFQCCKGLVDDAHKVLRQSSIKDMIRIGRTALISLRKVLVNLTKDQDYLLGKNFSLLDSPLREVARALVLSEPRFYEGLTDPKKFDLRFFSSLADLNLSVKAVNEIKFRSLLMGPKILGCNESMLKNHTTLSHATIYARFLVNGFFKACDPLGSLSPKEILTLFSEPGRLVEDFVMFAKKFAQELGNKLADNGYEMTHAQELSLSFSTLVLIQMEQNHRLLLD